MICTECGNQIVCGCGPVCLVCQYTGRGKPVTATEVKACLADAAEAERQARGLAAALDATYAALRRTALIDEPALTVLEAQESLAARIRNPEHNRKKPNWDEIDAQEEEEQREREPVCQSCRGTGQWLTFPCPDCSEDGDRERD